MTVEVSDAQTGAQVTGMKANDQIMSRIMSMISVGREGSDRERNQYEKSSFCKKGLNRTSALDDAINHVQPLLGCVTTAFSAPQVLFLF